MPRACRPRAPRRPAPRRLTPSARTLAAAALLALGGCAEVQQLQTLVTDRAPGSPPSERRLTIGPPGPRFADGVPAHAGVPPEPIEPAPPPAATPAAPAAVAMTVPSPAAAAPPRQPPLKSTRELIGLERSEVQARLGDPALRRRDNPAEIWQYRSPICVLDLFLYREGAATRVTNVELRPRDGRDLPAELCLSSL